MTEAEEQREKLGEKQKAFQNRSAAVDILYSGRGRVQKRKTMEPVALFPSEIGADQLLKVAKSNLKTSTELVAALEEFIQKKSVP